MPRDEGFLARVVLVCDKVGTTVVAEYCERDQMGEESWRPFSPSISDDGASGDPFFNLFALVGTLQSALVALHEIRGADVPWADPKKSKRVP